MVGQEKIINKKRVDMDEAKIILMSTTEEKLKEIIGDVVEEKLKVYSNQHDKNVPLSPKDFAHKFNLGVSTVRKYIKEGIIPFEKIGGSIVIYLDKVRESAEGSEQIQHRKIIEKFNEKGISY